MINVGDFILRYKKLNKTHLLPLERIETVEGDCFLVTNRFRAVSTISKLSVIKLDREYEVLLWDEIIQLEKQILFLLDCQKFSKEFRFLQGVGIVRLTQKNGEVSPQNKPWIKIECNPLILEELPEIRIIQTESLLLEHEEQHEFVSEAIDFLC